MQDAEHMRADPAQAPFDGLPVPPPDDMWPHQLDDGHMAPAAPPRANAAPEEPPRRSGRPRRGRSGSGAGKPGMRSLLVACGLGIAVLGYLQFAPRSAPSPDLLGTRLPATGLPEPAAEEPARDTIDPRLGGPESRPQEWAVPAAAGAVTQAETVTAEAAAAPEPVREEAAAPAAATVPRNLPVVQAAPAVEAVQAPAAPARSGPTNAELLEQLRQMQSALAALTQQLGQLQQAHESFASASARRGPPPAPSPSPSPSPVPSPVPASMAERKPAQHKPAGAPAKVAAVRPATQRPPRIRPQETPAAVAEKPAAPLAGQLVAVDMWNGEPSVVVASGVPGDRRLRVLRPGDVVNGLALKSADPVARSATFAAPGSAGLTLFVNQGG